MPRNTREWSRREIDYSVNNIKWAMYHLQQVAEVYHAAHPEIADPLNVLTEVLNNVSVNLDVVKSHY
jgi:ribosomal protein S6